MIYDELKCVNTENANYGDVAARLQYTGWPKKSKPPPIFQKIALKIANEIRFRRKVKV